MILSLVSIVTCGPLLSIPGLVLGKIEMNAIREGRAPQAGEIPPGSASTWASP